MKVTVEYNDGITSNRRESASHDNVRTISENRTWLFVTLTGNDEYRYPVNRIIRVRIEGQENRL